MVLIFFKILKIQILYFSQTSSVSQISEGKISEVLNSKVQTSRRSNIHEPSEISTVSTFDWLKVLSRLSISKVGLPLKGWNSICSRTSSSRWRVIAFRITSSGKSSANPNAKNTLWYFGYFALQTILKKILFYEWKRKGKINAFDFVLISRVYLATTDWLTMTTMTEIYRWVDENNPSNCT